MCNDGGESGITISTLDFDSVLQHFRSVACPKNKYKGKQIFDLTVPLNRNMELKKTLDSISQQEKRNSLVRLLTELQAISLDQTVGIRGIQEFVTSDWFDKQIQQLQHELQRLQEKDSFDIQDIKKLGIAVKGFIDGGTLFSTGIEGAVKLFKTMPTDSLPSAANFFWENRGKFSEAAKKISKGAGQVINGVNTVNDFIEEATENRKERKRTLKQLRDKIMKLSNQKMKVTEGIQRAGARAESQWRDKLEQVYQAQAVEESLGRNVSLILEAMMAQNILHGLAKKNVFEQVNNCSSSFRRFKHTLINFNPVPVLFMCGGVTKIINTIQDCLKQQEPVDGGLLGVETSDSLIMIGNHTHAVDCYHPRIGF